MDAASKDKYIAIINSNLNIAILVYEKSKINTKEIEKKVWMDENCFKMRHELLSLAKKLQLNPQNNHFLC